MKTEVIVIENERVVGLVTDQGTIRTESVVLCCGLWTRTLAARAGVNVPLAPVHHQYLMTETIAGVTGSLEQGVRKAESALAGGAARAKLEQFIAFTGRVAPPAS